MGHQLHHHHQAVDGLVNLFTKANNDLIIVQNRLEKEFRETYPDNANPMKLVSRIKKIQEELPSLKEQCRELLSAKQDLIDKARTTIVGNRASLQRLQSSMGIPVTSDSDDPSFTNFNQVIDEWAVQVRSRTGNDLYAQMKLNSYLAPFNPKQELQEMRDMKVLRILTRCYSQQLFKVTKPLFMIHEPVF